ncbi:MAG: THUMP domain-containing protein [Candidatus Woesearchaeota archaeon]
MDILVRYGEIGLKGKNRKFFEQCLQRNIKRFLKSKRIRHETVIRSYNRIIIENCEDFALNLNSVYGITSYSPAIRTDCSDHSIMLAIDHLLECKTFESFRITARILDDTAKESTMEINKKFGRYVQEKYKKKVSLKEHDLNIGIEFLRGRCYVFCEKKPGPGGLPSGVSGVVKVVGTGKKSVFAAKLLMKRGCKVVFNKPELLKDYSYGLVKKEIIKKNKEHPSAVALNTTSVKRIPPKKGFILLPLIGFAKEDIKNAL